MYSRPSNITGYPWARMCATNPLNACSSLHFDTTTTYQCGFCGIVLANVHVLESKNLAMSSAVIVFTWVLMVAPQAAAESPVVSRFGLEAGQYIAPGPARPRVG